MIAETYKGIRPARVIPCPDHLENQLSGNYNVEEEIGVTLTEVWQCGPSSVSGYYFGNPEVSIGLGR
jgi:cobalamin-dependent methionine synthase I